MKIVVKIVMMVVAGLVMWGAVTGETGAPAGGPPTAATEIPTTGGHGAVFGIVVVVVFAWAFVAKSAKAISGGRASTPAPVLRSEGGTTRRDAVQHEKGHVRALRRSGAGGGTYRVKRHRDGSWSGRTEGRSEKKWERLPAWKKIGVLAAGRHAAPGTRHVSDDAEIQQVLAGVPARNQGRELRKGESAGRRWAR